MTAVNYLCEPCDGISLHRDGSIVWLRDASGREKEETRHFNLDENAREAVWAWRSDLYHKYHSSKATS